MADPVPTIGRIVQYMLSEDDARTVTDRRNRSTEKGNPAEAGAVYPMTIVRVWGDQPDSAVNGQVHLDGDDILWVTSVKAGDGPRCFSWPVRA